MIELLVLIAIAYAGARGVESITNTGDRRLDTKVAEKTVKTVAASSPKGGKSAAEPGPTEPGGTFSAAAPRSATIGGKAAVPLAVLTETGSTMWKAVGEGYRDRWPEIREERRRKMAERAARRRAEKDAAAAEREAAEERRKAQEATAAAGPPPPHPPLPTDPPNSAGPVEPVAPAPPTEADEPGPAAGRDGWDPLKDWDWDTEPVEPAVPAPPVADEPGPAAGRDGWDPLKDWDWDTKPVEPVSPIPEPRNPDRERAVAAELRAADAERKAEAARTQTEEARARAAAEQVAAAQRAEHEANERAAAAEERARQAEQQTEPEGTPAKARHLAAVPDPAPTGDPMSAPHAIIPEIRTLDGLMNALTLIRAMCEMRAEEALAIASDDLTLSNRLDQIEAEMADMEVDSKTRGEVDLLRESIRTQSQAAAQYGGAARDSGDFATAAAGAAYKAHGGIAEAVQSSPIESAAQAGYYER
ncbi:hypothetical protein [Streptomyces sp. NPDC002746]